jgi:hypothetical protein
MSAGTVAGIIFDFLTASGWAWTTYLAQTGTIDDQLRLGLLITLTVLFVLRHLWLAIPAAEKIGLVKDRDGLIRLSLRGLMNAHTKASRKHRHSKRDYSIRINVMLPTRKWGLPWGASLKMYYSHCPDGVIYTDEERALRWRKGQGTCGWAWKADDESIYDALRTDLSLPASRLTDKQRKTVEPIRSTLSVPIVYRDAVVGVLNLDSKTTVGYTLFDSAEIVALAKACAIQLAPHCVPHGVRG